jgi:hypothetical protein
MNNDKRNENVVVKNEAGEIEELPLQVKALRSTLRTSLSAGTFALSKSKKPH